MPLALRTPNQLLLFANPAWLVRIHRRLNKLTQLAMPRVNRVRGSGFAARDGGPMADGSMTVAICMLQNRLQPQTTVSENRRSRI
jgi:hypothetical protein